MGRTGIRFPTTRMAARPLDDSLGEVNNGAASGICAP
jgi:hypothetical protein